VELFNKIGKHNGGKALSAKDIPLGEPFVYNHLGSMASVGGYKALVDLRQSKVIKRLWL
jgi:NADH:ubiquinone reductase (non-electrogenic)